MSNELDDGMLNKAVDRSAIDIEKEIKLLRKALEPENLAKTLDRSTLTINHIRCWLQILALILTIVTAAAVTFGFLGYQNLRAAQNDAAELKQRALDAKQYSESAQSNERKIAVLSSNIQSTIETFSNRVTSALSVSDDQMRRSSNAIETVSIQASNTLDRLNLTGMYLAMQGLTNETFDTGEPNRRFVASKNDGGVFVVLVLSHVPKAGTGSFQFGQNRGDVLKNSFTVNKNIVTITFIKGLEAALQVQPFFATYSPDFTRNGECAAVTFSKDQEVSVDGMSTQLKRLLPGESGVR